MPQPKSSGPPDRRNLREGKVLIFMIYIFMIYIFSYNARYVKQREAKKPSFPDFGSFSVPPAFRPPMPRFADFAAIYLFFMILYFVFIIIWFFGLYSLYNLFCPALVVCQSLFIFAFKTVPIFLFFCARPFGCVEPNRWLHSGWHFRGYHLKHRFRSAQTFLIVPTMPSCSRFTNVPLTCLYRISADWKTNRCRGGFLLHSVNFVNLFTGQTKKHLLILRS